MEKMRLAWALLLPLVGLLMRGDVMVEAQEGRRLVTGQPCLFPFDFNGETFTDCMAFSGREWCQGAEGTFGVCEPVGTGSPGSGVTSLSAAFSVATDASSRPDPTPATAPASVSVIPAAPTAVPPAAPGAAETAPSASNAEASTVPPPIAPPTTPVVVPTTAPSLPETKPGVAEAGSFDCCGLLAAAGFTSELPVIVLDSRGEDVPDEPKINGIMCTCGSPGGDISHPMGIEIRGSTSARDFEKKSFSMETRDVEGEDLDVNLLGLNGESDWILYGPELDKTMGMKNYLTMKLYHGTGRYASAVVYCEVFLIEDGGALDLAHYNGVYVVMEKVKRDKHRVNIAKNEDEDLSGGYIFRYDNNNFDPGDRIFTSNTSGLEFILAYPKRDDAEDHHLGWISSYVAEFEAALATGLRRNWLPFIDEGSFIDIFLITELTKNPDGYRGSFYFHKEAGMPMSAGPPWDYNEAYGTCCGYPIEGYLDDGVSNGLSGGSAISPEGWRFNICIEPERCQVDPSDGVSRWFQALMADKVFRRRVARRWAELRNGPWSDQAIDTLLFEARQRIENAVGRNHDRWNTIFGDTTHAQYIATWKDEVDSVWTWLIAHLEWMDGQLAVVEQNAITPSAG